nr:uncharacterized protein LOC104086501 [Nicotiana tomentosiformis]
MFHDLYRFHQVSIIGDSCDYLSKIQVWALAESLDHCLVAERRVLRDRKVCLAIVKGEIRAGVIYTTQTCELAANAANLTRTRMHGRSWGLSIGSSSRTRPVDRQREGLGGEIPWRMRGAITNAKNTRSPDSSCLEACAKGEAVLDC